jgi:hypothetical protein
MARFARYHFRLAGISGVSNDDCTERSLNSRIQEVARGDEVICVFGASHSRVLSKFMRPFIPSATVIHVNVGFARDLAFTTDSAIAFRVRFHADRNSKPKIAGRNYTISLVGIGQRDAAWKGDRDGIRDFLGSHRIPGSFTGTRSARILRFDGEGPSRDRIEKPFGLKK